MVLAQLGDRTRIASVDGAEEFLGLTMKLLPESVAEIVESFLVCS
jgi:hypothetical protein